MSSPSEEVDSTPRELRGEHHLAETTPPSVVGGGVVVALLLLGIGALVVVEVYRDDGGVRRDADVVQADVEDVARSLEDLVVAREPVVVRSCQNHGSGPIPPTTKIDLARRDDVSLEAVQAASEAALRGMGYEVRATSGDEPAVVVGRRQVSKERRAEITLYDSASSEGDLVIGTALVPPITC